MANDYFQFKQFTIRQAKCAMKVGTDGTLLGAWARGGSRILDIGSGTGLVALMMAQRFPHARIMGIDIDAEAVAQARANVQSSPFNDSGRMDILLSDVCTYTCEQPFDAIVSNPPYYDHSLACPDEQRTLARHTLSLSYRDLMAAAWRLLSEEGELSLVIPTECKSKLESEAALAGFFKVRECTVKTTPRKPVRRYLLAFRKRSCHEVELAEGIIELSPRVRSPWYVELTKDFYL